MKKNKTAMRAGLARGDITTQAKTTTRFFIA